jgi:DNA-binding winged helix-turn-helix (wHTH) protein
MLPEVDALYEFGSYRLDASKRLLTRDGKTMLVAPKTFDLLLLFIRSQGRVLTKTELMNSLWPDTFVEEANLSFQISTLRKAVGNEGLHWIETVPKRGYRFSAVVLEVDSRDESVLASGQGRPPNGHEERISGQRIRRKPLDHAGRFGVLVP